MQDAALARAESVPLSAYVPAELKQALRESARRNSRSLSGELRFILLGALAGPRRDGHAGEDAHA